MSDKTKNILFYVLAVLCIAGALTCAVVEGVVGSTLPNWASILLCASVFIFAVAGTLLGVKAAVTTKGGENDEKDQSKDQKDQR